MSYQSGALPQVQKGGFLLAQTGAATLMSIKTAISSSITSVLVFVNVTAWTTPASFSVVVSYTDENGVGHSDTLSMTRGSTGAIGGTITAVDRWYGIWIGSIVSSATILVVTAGTFTGSPVYDFFAVITAVG